MDVIRRRNNSPETRRLVDQRIALSRPGTLRRRYDHQSQRTIFAQSRPNKRSREGIADIDAELIRRANRLGGGYQPLQVETEKNPEEGEIEQEPEDTEEDSIIMRGDNLPIVNLSKYNTVWRIQYNTQRSQIHTNQSHCGKPDGKQENNRRQYQKSGVRIHAGFKDTNLKDRNRSGINPCQNKHETRRSRNRTRRIQTGVRKAIYSVGPCIRR